MTADARRDLARPQQPEDVREELAAALREFTPLTGWQSDLHRYGLTTHQAGRLLDALLPVLARLEAAWRADEREKALAERGTCGDLSPAFALAAGSSLAQVMCELAPGHDGAHQAQQPDSLPPMRWLRAAPQTADPTTKGSSDE